MFDGRPLRGLGAGRRLSPTLVLAGSRLVTAAQAAPRGSRNARCALRRDQRARETHFTHRGPPSLASAPHAHRTLYPGRELIDTLKDAVRITEDQANGIIMAARAHWFADEDEASAESEEG